MKREVACQGRGKGEWLQPPEERKMVSNQISIGTSFEKCNGIEIGTAFGKDGGSSGHYRVVTAFTK